MIDGEGAKIAARSADRREAEFQSGAIKHLLRHMAGNICRAFIASTPTETRY